MKSKKILITGVNGQDGSYLAEIFLRNGYLVYGIGKQIKSKWIKSGKDFFYIKADLNNGKNFKKILVNIKPDSIYHIAAHHESSDNGYLDQFDSIFNVNTFITKIILDYIKDNNRKIFFYYASSNLELELRVNKSFFDREQPHYYYRLSKFLSTSLIEEYRKKYNLRICIIWLYNHESIRRSSRFFIPKILDALKKSISNKSFKTEVKYLDFFCDWGDAQEFMEILYKFSKKKLRHDLIIATGTAINARSFVSNLFFKYGLDYKDHIISLVNNPNKIKPITADISKLVELNLAPKKKILNTIFNIGVQKNEIKN
jgi:GDPmannose 4,6-dehydratase